MPLSGVVHVVTGFSRPTSQAAARGERVFMMTDRLSCGPLEPLGDVVAWTAGRRAYWESIEEYARADEEETPRDDPAELASAEKIVAWPDASIDDQLTLAFLVAVLRAAGAAPQIDLVQFDVAYPRILYDPEEPGAFPPAVTLTRDDLLELERTWDALTASEPDALVGALASARRLPFLERALGTLLLRYPGRTSGVNASELRILNWARGGHIPAARIIGNVMGDVRTGTQDLDHVGDGWVFQRLLRLGDPSLREPALEVAGSRPAYRHKTVRLTSFGERVLTGKANFVEVNGIDDWVAGVHLQSALGRVWFHDRGALVRG